MRVTLSDKKNMDVPLEPGESALAWFEPDLDQRLHFIRTLVVLTDRRMLAIEPSSNGAVPQWRSWPLEARTILQTRDHLGVGTLELIDDQQRLAHWRFTSKISGAAEQMLQALLRHRTRQPAVIVEAVCPGCGQKVTAPDGVCPLCKTESTTTSLNALFRLAGFSRRYAGLIFAGFLLTFASTAAGLVPPYLTIPLLDRVLIPYQTGGDADFSLLVWYLSGLFGAGLLAWVLDWARLFVLARASERVSAALRSHTYSHLLRLSVEFFGGHRTGDLMSRVSSDTDRICNFLSANLVDFATDVLMIIMTAAILLTIDWQLALIALCPFPLIVWLVYRVRGRLLRGYQQSAVAWSSMTSVLADTIPGIRVVKAFAQEQREIDRFNQTNEHVFNVNNRLNRIWAFFGPTVTLLTTTGLLIIWAFASWQVYRHAITVGVLTAFLAYIARFYTRIESMIRMTSAIQRASASAQRIFQILDRPISMSKPTGDGLTPAESKPEQTMPIVAGRIELRDIRFKYGSREVLHGLSLEIEPGEMIGLVGHSGAGKTTLINLICRFYDVAAGAILVDDRDIRTLPVEQYRRSIGIVLQEPFLFYGTVAENISYGRPGATRAEIVAAARAARAHEFILRLANGYDSLVGERGQSLSGGERQRISIARALLIDPRILILDEATSSVDTETEREIQEALDNLIQGRTTIAIAHRLSTLRRANRLVVLQHGRIVEIGSHDELLQRDGMYARLYHTQMEQLTHGQIFA